MKIVDRKTFLKLPAGTIYAKYEPCIFGELNIKQATVKSTATGEPIDWWYQDLIPWFEGTKDGMEYLDTLEAIRKGEREAPAFDYNNIARDGYFDPDQLFAVFEARDVRALIDRLNLAWHDGYAKE